MADYSGLKRATREYVEKETKRIDAEVASLKGILRGRVGSQGVAARSIDVVEAVAASNLSAYLKE